MHKIKYYISTLIAIMAIAIGTTQAYAEPTFPSCANVQGALKVENSSGVHGIAGRADTYTGSDKVYQIDANNLLMQCFCPENGNGIQTNWWKANHLSDDQIKVLKSQGWIYITEGTAWGLDSGPYLAKNSDYNCKPTTTSNNSSTNNVGSSSPIVQVLSLANTGNIIFIYTIAIAGLLSISTGLFLYFAKK